MSFRKKLKKFFPEKKTKKQKRFDASYAAFKEKTTQLADQRFALSDEHLYPCLDDATATTGFDAHYIYHTGWAVRRIKERAPRCHIDLSSYLYFSTLLSAFIPVEFYDYRPANVKLGGLNTGQADLNALPFADDSIGSLSCMHTVEHVGLGRYGDELDPLGDLKAIRELTRVLAPGGLLYFVVPIGKPRVCFNAHRIYSYGQVVEAFSDLELLEFSLIGDDAEYQGMIEHAAPAQADSQDYGCGCFIFSKPGGRDADR